jgi:hypothetical protein
MISVDMGGEGRIYSLHVKAGHRPGQGAKRAIVARGDDASADFVPGGAAGKRQEDRAAGRANPLFEGALYG